MNFCNHCRWQALAREMSILTRFSTASAVCLGETVKVGGCLITAKPTTRASLPTSGMRDLARVAFLACTQTCGREHFHTTRTASRLVSYGHFHSQPRTCICCCTAHLYASVLSITLPPILGLADTWLLLLPYKCYCTVYQQFFLLFYTGEILNGLLWERLEK